jgi:CubicO group peptidase (beta-lactamase class C family)
MRWLRLVCLLLSLFPSIRPQTALALQQPATPTAVPKAEPSAAASGVPATSHPLTSADLEAFFDGIVPLQLERSDIAGASVLVMRNGQVLLQKGYGFADIKKKQPVDPASTIFRLASISKLSTWISVMQLEEQGRLDLDTDINRYLDFKIRPAFGQPITLRDLMTHTGGFEEESKDVIITDPKQAVSLRDFLIRNQPMRLFPPGQIPAYSNYGVGLASYIVQRISGEPFEQYTERHIYEPLRMAHSSFRQPLPKGLTPSEGYGESTVKPAIGFEIFNPVGAGGFSSTAADMGRFGSMMLNGGELDGARVLRPETMARMWTPQFEASPGVPPICMGFYQVWRNDLRWIGHEGDLIAFHSLFFVEPTQKLVLFVSYNSAGGGARPRPEIINQFSDRYFPAPPHKQAFLTLPRGELKQVEGTYTVTRRADSTKLRLFSLMEQATVAIDKDGAAVVDSRSARDLRLHAIHWKPIGKDLWQEVDGQQTIFAIRDHQGRVIRFAVDFPGVQLERLPWYENRLYVFSLVGLSLLVLLLVVIAATWRFGRRLCLRKRPRPAPQPGTAWLPVGAQIAAWLWILLVATLVAFTVGSGDDALPPTPAWDKYFVMGNVVAAVAMLFSAYAVFAAVRTWPGTLRLITKVKYALVAAALLVLCWFAVSYHLIGQVERI